MLSVLFVLCYALISGDGNQPAKKPQSNRIVTKIYTRPTIYKHFSHLGKGMLNHFAFMTKFTNSINSCIAKLGYDYIDVEPYVSKTFMLKFGKALNLSTLQCDWCNLKVSYFHHIKNYTGSLLLNDLLITFAVLMSSEYGGISEGGLITIVIPLSSFQIELHAAEINMKGEYYPFLANYDYKQLTNEEIHYALLPKMADRQSAIKFWEIKEQVRYETYHHYRNVIQPEIKRLMKQIIEQTIDNNVIPLPLMIVDEKDKREIKLRRLLLGNIDNDNVVRAKPKFLRPISVERVGEEMYRESFEY